MNTENIQTTPATGGMSAESTSANVATETSINEVAPSTPSVGGETIDTALPTYTPNFKYKAAFQEKELDGFWHPLIKDPDSEKKVKEIFTRADAFDMMKDKYEKRDTDYSSLQKDYETQARVVQKVVDARQKSDFDSVFRNLNMTDHEVLQWAAKKIDYLNMMNGLAPEQRTAIERQQQAVYANETYQEQLNETQSLLQQQKTQVVAMQLDIVLSKPEVQQMSTSWDEKMGSGAFKQAVIEEGQNHWLFTQQQTGQGVVLTPEDAISKVLHKFGKFISLQQGGSAPQESTPQGTQYAQQNTQSFASTQAKPVIPAIPGSSKTPIKKQFTSLDEIKKHAKELERRDSGY